MIIQKINTIFISPVKIPLALSANFGELRIDHFHSGIDIKTQGVTGKEVVAAAVRICLQDKCFSRRIWQSTLYQASFRLFDSIWSS